MNPKDIENPIAEQDFRYQLKTEFMDNLQIQTRTKCDSCKGEGELLNKEWWGGMPKGLSPQDRIKWFKGEHPEYPFKEELPPRTINCNSCGGAGYTARYMPLRELKDILDNMELAFEEEQ